jgi:hypothetical protein
MQRYVLGKFNSYIIPILIIIIFITLPDVIAGGKAGVYGIYMVPRGEDAKNYSQPGLGFGFHVVVPVPQLANILAGTVGLEFINLLEKTIDYWDRTTGLRVEQNISQNYFRLFIGAQVGGHGNAFFRPHAGMNIALVYYNISTEIVEAYSSNEEEIILSGNTEGHVVAGYDITLGIDLNFSNEFAIDGGIRYVKSFSVPLQLGAGSVKIHPQYFQIYLGIGVGFN